MVEAAGAVFDRFESLEVVNDIDGVAEAVLDMGDDGSYPALAEIIAPGEPLTVRLNGQLRMTGRAEVNEIPGSADGGVRIRLAVRTKLSDAKVSSADPKIAVRNVSIKEAILAAFAPLGLVEADFVFGEFVDVDLLTGKGIGGSVEVDLAPVQQAKVQPPETIFDFVSRHLERFQATMWDSPDGRIIIGRPDDTQAPLYRLQAKRGPSSRGNNVGAWNWVKDWSEIPRSVRVYGHTWGKDITKSHFRADAIDADVDEVATRTGHFNRLVLVHDQTSKDRDRAAKAAQRELVRRIKRKDAIEIDTDGWSFWTGSEQIPYSNNTTVNVDVDALGGDLGSYLVIGVALRLTVGAGATTRLMTLAPGVWQL